MTETAAEEQAGSRERSYVAGDWYAVIGRLVTVVLTPGEKARVPALWALVDDGAGFEEVLDALISDGLRALTGFVLLGSVDDTTLVVVRGTARAVFEAGGERVEVAGSSSTTWAERSLRDVTGVVVELQDVPDDAPSYAIEQGLVRLSRLTEGVAAVEPAPVVPAATPGAARESGEPDGHRPGGSGLLDGAPAAVVVAAGGVGGAVAASDADDGDDDERGAESGAEDEGSGEPATHGAEDLLPAPGADALSDPPPGRDPADPEPEEDEAAGDEPAEDEPVDDETGADEVTEVLAVERPAVPAVDPEGTEPFEPLGPPAPLEPAEARVPGDPDDDLMQDFTHDDDPLGLDPDFDRDPLGLVGGGAWAGSPVDPGPFVPEQERPGLRSVGPAGSDPDDGSGVGADHEPLDHEPLDHEPLDHDGETRYSPWDESGLSLVRPGIPGQEPAPAVTSRPVARLLVSDGRRIDVDRVVVLGRAPSARRFDDAGTPLLVRVESPHQEISATHVEIRPGSGADHGTAVVTDLGSTNGTVVAQPGLEPDELQPGVSVQLIPGAIIDLGDGVTLQVVRP